jgi:predicted nucleotidyltransferase
MEGPALERRLQLGRVAFYGAFEVPDELKQYDIA